MLKSISLENYKCFKNETKINISPLTVLCGVNSSGKSSILKSLLMLKQTAESSSIDGSVVFSGNYVDCGTFESVIYNKDNNKDEIDKQCFTLKNTFLINNHRLVKTGKFIKRQDAKDFNELRRIYSLLKGNIKYFLFDTEIIIEKYTDETNEFLKYITNNQIKLYRINIKAFDQNDKLIEDSIGYIKFSINEMKRDSIEPHFLSWNNIPGFTQSAHEFKDYICSCSFSGLTLLNIFAYNMQNNVKGVVPTILSIFRIVANQYHNINYIAPLRNMPQRTYLIQNNDTSSVGINGENTSTLLAKIKSQNILTDIYCPWTNSLPVDENGFINSDYYTIIQQWLEYFEMDSLNVDGKNGTINLKIGNHNIADVGFGLSQILPIITQGVYMSKEEILMIEQPEIHLHPKMELSMADFLITLARRERNIIVETHSDHIINRIVKRILEDPSLVAEDNPIIKIIFIDRDESSMPNAINIHVDKYKGITNAPKNFFTQFGFETMDISKIGYDNYKKDKGK